jgi:hypothetical protein
MSTKCQQNFPSGLFSREADIYFSFYVVHACMHTKLMQEWIADQLAYALSASVLLTQVKIKKVSTLII